MDEKIAVCGLAGVGKTTLAKKFSEKYGNEVISFASPLKEITEKVLGRKINKSIDRPYLIALSDYIKGNIPLIPVLFNYIEEKDTEPLDKIRIFEQRFWEVIFKYDYKNLLFKKTSILEMVTSKIQNDKRYIIDDLRYQIEYNALQELGFTIVYLEASKEICSQRLIDRDGSCNLSIYDQAPEKEHLNFGHYDILIDATKSAEKVFSTLEDALLLNE